MKNPNVFLVLFLLFAVNVVVAQAPLSTGYYVVVAAYNNTREDYAKKFTDQLTAKGNEAHYGLSESGKLYLVYVHYHANRKESLTEMKVTRQKGQFSDAWVRVVKNGDQDPVVAEQTETKPTKSTEQNSPTTNKEVAAATVKEEPTPDSPANSVREPTPVQQSTVTLQETTIAPIVSEVKKQAMPAVPFTLPLQSTKVFFNLVYATKNTPINGEVQIIDTERSRLIEKAKGNKYVVLPDPKSNSDQLTLTADVFGYRKVQHEIKYPLPLADTVQDFVHAGDSALVVTFELVRYQRGDIQTLYNVYFFNDAAIMLPESKYELNSLLLMMQENENYEIRLHGHSNGNHHGKILALGPNKNFFDIEGTIQGQGSAKDLSGQRASTIKEYLVANGIATHRVEVKAWGGKKPIYDKHSTNAKKNVRVEVEILSN